MTITCRWHKWLANALRSMLSQSSLSINLFEVEYTLSLTINNVVENQFCDIFVVMRHQLACTCHVLPIYLLMCITHRCVLLAVVQV